MAIEWYVRQGDEVQGPVSSSRLKQMADREEITPETPVREGSHGAWVAAGTIEDLFTGAGGAARRTPRPAQPTPGPGAAASPATPAGQAPAGPVQQPTPTTQQAPQPAAAAAGAAPPAAGDPAPAQPDEDAPCWHLQTADGARYGPATRAQLDQWFNQGRVGTTCLLWRPGWDQWRPAPAVYPQLAQQPAAPGPSGGTPTPQKPAAPGPSGGTVAPQKPAAPGPSGGTPTPQKPAVPGAPASPAPQDPYTVRMSAAATATGLGGPRPSAPESLAGQTLDRYEILGLLGRGPMGAVYKARHTTLDRPMALRVLPGSQDARFLERFRDEFRAAASLVHPNIVEIHDVGQEGGHTYIAMELVEGGSLADVLRRNRRLGVGRALQTMKQVTAALGAAHAAGVIHRDVKPSNILLGHAGRAKLGDFSLALRRQGGAGASGAGPAAAQYAAPETVRGQAPDARSDLYSLGATYYHLLAGRPVFGGSSDAEVAQKHVQAQARPLAEAAPGIPPSLCRVIDRLLAKDPGARYPSAEQLSAALGKVMVPLSVPQPVLQPAPDGQSPAATGSSEAQKRRWVLIAALGGALLLGLAIVALVLVLVLGRTRPPQDAPPEAPSEPGVEEPAPVPAEPAPSQPAPGEAAP